MTCLRSPIPKYPEVPVVSSPIRSPRYPLLEISIPHLVNGNFVFLIKLKQSGKKNASLPQYFMLADFERKLRTGILLAGNWPFGLVDRHLTNHVVKFTVQETILICKRMELTAVTILLV